MPGGDKTDGPDGVSPSHGEESERTSSASAPGVLHDLHDRAAALERARAQIQVLEEDIDALVDWSRYAAGQIRKCREDEEKNRKLIADEEEDFSRKSSLKQKLGAAVGIGFAAAGLLFPPASLIGSGIAAYFIVEGVDGARELRATKKQLEETLAEIRTKAREWEDEKDVVDGHIRRMEGDARRLLVAIALQQVPGVPDQLPEGATRLLEGPK